MQLELTDEETFALLNLLVDTIEGDRYPMSPRIRLLREILSKFGEVGGLSPDLSRSLRRHAPPPPARRPTPEERDPSRGPPAARTSTATLITRRPVFARSEFDATKSEWLARKA
jgi:hypothetical protein